MSLPAARTRSAPPARASAPASSTRSPAAASASPTSSATKTCVPRIADSLDYQNKVITAVYGGEPIDVDTCCRRYLEYGKRLAPFVGDVQDIVLDAHRRGDYVLLEGAQGSLLDLDHGTYPYVTSSVPSSSSSGGAGARRRHRPHRHPARRRRLQELLHPRRQRPLPDRALRRHRRHSFATTARSTAAASTAPPPAAPRRIGWLDAVAARYSVRFNGLSAVALTRLDVLDNLPTIKICTAYELDGEIISHLPVAPVDLERVTPDLRGAPRLADADDRSAHVQAMACAVNYAFCNRHAIMHWVRQSFQQVFQQPPENFGLKLVYDVTHNIAKVETHRIDGGAKKVWVHRKGATRAFPPGHPDIPVDYRSEGQPVLIPGSMGTSSWILAGTEKAMDLTFGSTAHGAGRMMSRSAAKRQYWGGEIKQSLEKRGIVVRAASASVLAEEADPAYKNVDVVADVSDKVGIATKVARLVPLAVVKG